MSFLKKFGKGDGKSASSAQSSPPRGGAAAGRKAPVASGGAVPKATIPQRPRSGTDPETCLEVFKSHWLQAVTLMNKVNMAPAGRTGGEEIEAVRQHIDHLMWLLVEEAGQGADNHGQVGN